MYYIYTHAGPEPSMVRPANSESCGRVVFFNNSMGGSATAYVCSA